ncbi:PREDICTED: uncharacterized protein LOC107071601 [Polistes dominula]|uniref:Uncharacterized protein LOC107071601 n=1 Tax=Polistes dominula TaxID=743375 RepID=A0ABM1J177_POLDO|nr:PREDICTED: uncharacterized protein LOC107071601 [Polistes dominula]
MTKERLNKNLRGLNKANEISYNELQAIVHLQIPEVKWREIFEEENHTFIVNSILNEIISSAMEIIYDVYLEKAVYSFVVHCSHIAWLQLFDAMHLQYDLGEDPASIKKYWMGDKEHKPSPIDLLCFKNVEVRKKCETCSHPENCQKS